MSNITTLPADIQTLAQDYTIPGEFLEKSPDIIVLILRSQSLASHDEKQNWFNLLPLMNEQQMAKLNTILVKEQEKLKEIETKYDVKKTEIEDKYLKEWHDAGYLDVTQGIKKQEETVRQKEEEEADALLQNL